VADPVHEYPEAPCSQPVTVESSEHVSDGVVVTVQPVIATARASDVRAKACLERIPTFYIERLSLCPVVSRFSDRLRAATDEPCGAMGDRAIRVWTALETLDSVRSKTYLQIYLVDRS
jgi:hypothetical protein